MLAETYATEEMKKDVNDLCNMIADAGDKRFKASGFISLAYGQVLHHREYIKATKQKYEHKLAVLEITDDSTVARQAAEKTLSLLTKYNRKELLIVLESVLQLEDNLICSRKKLR